MHRFRYGLLACAAIVGLTTLSLPAVADVQIDRDEFGVPKITANTDAEMWFAFGFAQARDRLIQLEIMRQEAYGKLPEVDGVDVIGATNRKTRNWKRLHLFPDLKEKLEDELGELRDEGAQTLRALTCFTQGIQAFKNLIVPGDPELQLQECRVTQQNLDKLIISQTHDLAGRELAFIQSIFRKQNLPVGHEEGSVWEVVDSLALFHLRVMHEFSLRNTEMKNLKLLHDLYQTYNANAGDEPPAIRAAKVFNSIKWSLHPNAKTTIPVLGGYEDLKPQAQQKAEQYHSKLMNPGDDLSSGIHLADEERPLLLNGCGIYSPDLLQGIVNQSTTLTAHITDSPFPLNASNWWMISQPGQRNVGGISNKPNSLLYNGPQISAIDPSHTYQVALESKQEGSPFQFAGNAYIGSPNFWQGHNGTMAFGLTAGNIDVSDVFCVSVTKDGDGKWGYDDGDRQVFENILQLGPELSDFQAAAKAYARPHQFGEVLANMYTVGETGWPVLAIDKELGAADADGKRPETGRGTAYILRYNWQGKTASTLHNWLQATQTKNHDEWNHHLNGVAGNFNLSAAHRDGTISYRLVGALPIKQGMSVEGEDAQRWNYYPAYDPRLPAPMTPKVGWRDEHTFHNLRFEVRAPQDSEPVFIANWNQKPFINMPDGDLDYDAYTPYDRAFIIERLLADHRGPWSQREVQEMNGRLQRMDVNYIIFKPFLTESKEAAGGAGEVILRLMLSWDGKRGDYRKGDVRGLHKGHVLFYYWLENMADQFKNKIAGLEPDQQPVRKSLEDVLIGNLSKGQMKLKQPKLSWEFEENIREKHSTETSHNIHLGSRIMLQALHAAFGAEFSGKFGFPGYQNDEAQYRFIEDRGEADQMITRALVKAIQDARTNGWNISLEEGEDPYLASGSATFSGLSKTLSLNDTQIGFRPGDPLEVKHFRNRGALNIVVGLWRQMVHGANISSPGIREYRGYPTPTTEQERLNDWSVNQLYLFRDNEYRPMHNLPTRPGEVE